MPISMDILHIIDYMTFMCFGMMFSIVCPIEADEFAFRIKANIKFLV